MTYNPFAAARLRRAVRALLKNRHGHPNPKALAVCPACVARLWEYLRRTAQGGPKVCL